MKKNDSKKLSGVDRANRYIENILSNKIPACEWVKLACARQKKDLENPPYYFDSENKKIKHQFSFSPSRANRVVRFLEALTQPSGQWANNNFILEDFQCFVVTTIFGWIDHNDYRRFNLAYISMARKNGKSALAAAISLYCLFADGEKNAKVKVAALDKNQAQIIVEYCETLIEDNPQLQEVYQPKCLGGSPPRKIRYAAKQSDLQPMAKEGGQHDGHSISFAVIDEYHAHKNDRMAQVIETSFGSRTQPLAMYITTAGFDLSSPCLQKENYIKSILKGEAEANRTFGCIWTLPDGSDWKDPDNWKYANPCLGVSTFPERLERIRDEALVVPDTRLHFLVKHCNTWQSSILGWINMTRYEECKSELDKEEFAEMLEGHDCVFGVDLSSRNDLTALSMVTKMDGKYFVRSHYFIPFDTAQMDHRYAAWETAGWCTIVRESSVEFDDVERYIVESNEKHPVEAVVLDPSLGKNFKKSLQEQGFDTIDYKQYVSYMSPALKEMHHEILNFRYVHDGNPISKMCFENLTVQKSDDGNVRIKKASAHAKNDGVISTAVVFGYLAFMEKPAPSKFGVYNPQTGKMEYI